MEQDKEFFASLQNLPQNERMAKMMQYFADNPPLPSMMPPRPPGQAGTGFNGFQASGGVPPIPPPDVRRAFEQAMVNGMKAAGVQ
jgi:hypothetical protein